MTNTCKHEEILSICRARYDQTSDFFYDETRTVIESLQSQIAERDETIFGMNASMANQSEELEEWRTSTMLWTINAKNEKEKIKALASFFSLLIYMGSLKHEIMRSYAEESHHKYLDAKNHATGTKLAIVMRENEQLQAKVKELINRKDNVKAENRILHERIKELEASSHDNGVSDDE